MQPCREGFLLSCDGGYSYPPLSVGVLVLGHELDHAPATLGNRCIVLHKKNNTTQQTVRRRLLLHVLGHCVSKQEPISSGGDEEPRLPTEETKSFSKPATRLF